MITNLYKKQPTAINYLTDPITPYQAKIIAKEQKSKERQKANEEGDLMEKTVENVLKTMPKLNLKQLELLNEFVSNLKFKK